MYSSVNFVCIKTIVLASFNLNKAEEIQMLLGNKFNVITQEAFDIPPIEETGSTFHENALLKAKNVFNIVDLPVIGDDSGLEGQHQGGGERAQGPRQDLVDEEGRQAYIL